MCHGRTQITKSSLDQISDEEQLINKNFSPSFGRLSPTTANSLRAFPIHEFLGYKIDNGSHA